MTVHQNPPRNPNRNHRPVAPSRRRALGILGLSALGASGLLTACSSGDPLEKESAADGSSAPEGAIVVGSQAYYSNEIIAELFAQVLEKAGASVSRQYQIGQREVYLPELEGGKIDLMPEYTGNLLQYYAKDATGGSAEEVAAQLSSALPEGLRALPYAAATDQDSYNTTAEFAQQHSLASLADLAGIADLKIAANSEFQTRPYGPEGLKATYGADVTVVPVEDSGGPLTVKSLTDGTTQLADIYSADPSIAKNGFVTLEDPKAMILPENVVPIASAAITDAQAAEIKKVTDALSTQELIALNTQSVDEQKKSAEIAKAWLTGKGLL